MPLGAGFLRYLQFRRVYKMVSCIPEVLMLCLTPILTYIHMYTSSQPQHAFAAERLFGGFGSFHSTTFWLIFYARLNIFLNEVLEHSDLLDSKLFMASTWLQDPLNSGGHKIKAP